VWLWDGWIGGGLAVILVVFSWVLDDFKGSWRPNEQCGFFGVEMQTSKRERRWLFCGCGCMDVGLIGVAVGWLDRRWAGGHFGGIFLGFGVVLGELLT
jgi:hypothetical protein